MRTKVREALPEMEHLPLLPEKRRLCWETGSGTSVVEDTQRGGALGETGSGKHLQSIFVITAKRFVCKTNSERNRRTGRGNGLNGQ